MISTPTVTSSTCWRCMRRTTREHPVLAFLDRDELAQARRRFLDGRDEPAARSRCDRPAARSCRGCGARPIRGSRSDSSICVTSSKLAATPGVRACVGQPIDLRDRARQRRQARRRPASRLRRGRAARAAHARSRRGRTATQAASAAVAARARAGRPASAPRRPAPAASAALDDARVHRTRVEEQHAPADARLVAPAQALRCPVRSTIERRAPSPGGGDERQRRRPVLELARDPFDLVRREVAGIEAHQQQRLQILLLERDARACANAPAPNTSCSRCQPRMRANS